MNVAHHSKQLMARATMISSVGQDNLGDELIEFLKKKEIPTHLVQKSEHFPTSVVKVELDERGSASYQIVEGVAWDDIQLSDRMLETVSAADVLVFGSLVARSTTSRLTLQALLREAKLCVFDINLRAPFYSAPAIESLLKSADIVKTNEEELGILAEWFGQGNNMSSMTQYLLDRFQLQKVIVTRGQQGAVCRDQDGWHEHPGYPIKVVDTVGSGDSFLAAYLIQMLKGESVPKALGFACAVGAFVATQSGGTPDLSASKLQHIKSQGQ